MKTYLKKSTKWMVFSLKMNPYVCSLYGRFHAEKKEIAIDLAKAFTDSKNKWRFIKLSAGQSKVIEALYKKENTNEQNDYESIRISKTTR